MLNINSIFADSFDVPAKMQSNESVKQSEETITNKNQKFVVETTESSQFQSNEDFSNDDFSFESSFEQSVEDVEDEEDSIDAGLDKMDDMPDEPSSGGDDFGGDDGFDDDSGGADGGTGGGTGSAGGVDDLDLNKGSSLNTFTQINQKLYHIDSLNKLLSSIKHTIGCYNDLYTDWSELNQLKALADIVDEERNSFVMQENPENLIKLRLYQEQYEKIVERLSILVKEKAKSQKA